MTALRRGVVSGAVGGLLAGAFGYLLAEPVMDRAVDLESGRRAAEQARAAAAGTPLRVDTEVFSRHTQHLGLIGATLLTGVAFGVLLALVYALTAGRKEHDGWTRSLRFGFGAWFGVYLVPFVRFPANPPGVGDAGTIDMRTQTYLASVVVGLIGVVVAGRVATDLRARGAGPARRQLAVAGVLIATVALPFVLPGNDDPLDVPAGLLWQFRLLAFATSTLLWAGLAVAFGLLNSRRPPETGGRAPSDRIDRTVGEDAESGTG